MNTCHTHTHTHMHIHTHMHSHVYRKLVCDVVRVKVESEENINRISRGNGEEIVMVHGC